MNEREAITTNIPKEGNPMRTITHVHKDADLETDTIIRLDNLNSMIMILECGICGDGDSGPSAESIRQYLFHLGQEVDLIRQNLEKISFQEILPGGRKDKK